MNKAFYCARRRPQPRVADGARHPRVIWAVSENEEASQKPFDGDPYTRLARTTWGRASHMGHRCVGFKAAPLYWGSWRALLHRHGHATAPGLRAHGPSVAIWLSSPETKHACINRDNINRQTRTRDSARLRFAA